MGTIKKTKKYQKSGPPLTVTKAGKFKKQTFEADTSGYSAGKEHFPTKVTTTRISKSGEESPIKNSPWMISVGRSTISGELNKREKMKKQEEEKAKGKMKTGGKIKKAQTGKKLPSGASSASAESDYAKSDSLRNVSNKMTGKDFFEMSRLKKPNPRIQSDSLKAEGDRKTKATGGVPKDYRFKKGGAVKKTAKKSMKMGGKVSKMMSKMKSKMSKKK